LAQDRQGVMKIIKRNSFFFIARAPIAF